MRLPEVVPLTDVSMDNVLATLRKAREGLGMTAQVEARSSLHAYQQWAGTASDMLSFSFAPEAVEKLLFSRRHWWLMDATANYTEPNRWAAIRLALTAEQRSITKAFDDLVQTYEAARNGSGIAPRVPVVAPDTNFFLHNPKPFDEVDWVKLTGAGENVVRLLVPIAVVRELDEKKRVAKQLKVGDTEELLRTRASRTVRKLRSLFDDPLRVSALSDRVGIELLLDPLSHHPRRETDLEIIERVLAAKVIIERDVKLVTLDNGMVFAAQTEGLSVLDPEAS